MDLEEIEEAATAPVAIERKKHGGKGKAATESQLSNLALGRAKRAGMKAAKEAEAEEKAVKKALVTKPPPPLPPPSPPPSPEPVKQQLVKPRQRKAEPEPEPEPVKKKKKKVIIVEADSSSDEEPQVIYKTKRKVATPPAPLYEEPIEIPRLRRA